MTETVNALLRRVIVAISGACLIGAAVVVGAPTAAADTPGICTNHWANTATWINCSSLDGRAHWARLITTCAMPFGRGTHTITGRWELVPAGGRHTISGSCTFKAAYSNAQWRPY